MARIKFLQEDFAGFRPDRVVKEYQLRPDQITTPMEAIQTIRQGVQLGKEVADVGIGAADFLTKAGVVGKQPTMEDLMNEAAKKRAEEARGVAAGERQKMVGEQEAARAEQAKLEAGGQPTYSREALGAINIANKTREDFVNKFIPDFKSGKMSQEDFAKQLDFAVSSNAISPEEKKAIEDQLAGSRATLQKAREAEAAAKAGATQAAAATQRVAQEQQAITAGQQGKVVAAQQARQQYATAPRTNEAADLEEQQYALDLQLLTEMKKAGKDTTELENAMDNRKAFIEESRKPNPDPAKLAELDATIKTAEEAVKQQEQSSKIGRAHV